VHCSGSYAVGIVTRLRAGRSGVRIAVEAGDLSPFHNVQTDSDAQPDSCSVGPGLFPRGVHLTTEGKNEWSCTPSFPVCFHSLDTECLNVRALDDADTVIRARKKKVV